MSVLTTKESKKTKLLLIGGTGDGKSSFGNFILKKNAFVVNDSPNPETKTTTGSYGEGDRSDVFVIDTPGLQDSSEMDESELNQMISYVNEQKGVDGIILVLNYNSVEFLDNIESLIKKLYNVFPIPDFWEHVSIVWTKCFCYISEKKREKQIEIKKEEYQEQLIRLVKETTGKEKSIAFPMFFVDSQPDEDEDNSRTDKEVEEFLKWARSLTPISVVEKDLKEDTKYKKVVVEEKEEIADIIVVKDGYVKLKIEKKKRELRAEHNGKMTCTEWEVIDTKCEDKPISKNYANISKEELIGYLNKFGTKLFELIVD
ncbi:hypothetical protein, conserved [Entamoeba dispar SAW760]|uniref:AIG1-type G domain-containing protein n=1 Tax=Entamoeba dispar (strain ATCC PRA-260 / SAW760) TaxID=370354 RepID=B0EJ65_ENTDS|nr:uncharacterized protein EDI_301170 [Entamoeba dispar SAW760]EDR25430.1 hypothetical protein, conserved [Entamoeba dispar SAW760]|eukprot:EDR25430.1 hypothetical protein, conserved [Entamoeba dispar SAW760]